jgi:hypothetical protein
MHFHDPIAIGCLNVPGVILKMVGVAFDGFAFPGSYKDRAFESYLFASQVALDIAFHKRDTEGDKVPVPIPLIHYVEHVCNPDHFHYSKIRTYTRVRKDRERPTENPRNLIAVKKNAKH